jgi:hypothetical protein
MGLFKENKQENTTRGRETVLTALKVITSKNTSKEGHILLLS